jgi:YHS domain-containing protein
MKTWFVSCLASLCLTASGSLHAAQTAVCPISGEKTDANVKLTVNGKDINFCCKDCVKSYEQKLNVTDNGPAKCPISGQPATQEQRQLHAVSEVTYFCCDNCPQGFAKDMKFQVTEEEPGKCPISGKPAEAASFLVHNGNKVYFCCDNCPSAFVKRLDAKDAGPQKCPVSGRPAVAASKMIVTKTEAVYFCCENCPKEYAKKNFASQN